MAASMRGMASLARATAVVRVALRAERIECAATLYSPHTHSTSIIGRVWCCWCVLLSRVA